MDTRCSVSEAGTFVKERDESPSYPENALSALAVFVHRESLCSAVSSNLIEKFEFRMSSRTLQQCSFRPMLCRSAASCTNCFT